MTTNMSSPWFERERIITPRLEPKPYRPTGTSLRQTVVINMPAGASRYDAATSTPANDRAVLTSLTPPSPQNELGQIGGEIDQRGAVIFQLLCRAQPWVRMLHIDRRSRRDDRLVQSIKAYFETDLRRQGWHYVNECNGCPWPANVILRIIWHHLSHHGVAAVYDICDRLLKAGNLDEKYGPLFLQALVLGKEAQFGSNEYHGFWKQWVDWRVTKGLGELAKEREEKSIMELFQRSRTGDWPPC
ncbi:hypothetical protein DL96DRAFT_1607100 [Flagelloscypha sp. PMI_526]|nr:hypothetical protein DL96DRAFT_1607100 [Flagelloscypha sp. PMI_526]